jgi:hypothetical protein
MKLNVKEFFKSFVLFGGIVFFYFLVVFLMNVYLIPFFGEEWGINFACVLYLIFSTGYALMLSRILWRDEHENPR